MLHLQNQKKLDKLSLGLANRCPEFSSLLLYAPRIAVLGEFIVKTDGKIIKVGEKFFELDFAKQVYKIIHIALHVGLRHHHRAFEIKGNDIALKIWEIATDVIINESIKDYVYSIVNNNSGGNSINFDTDDSVITLNKLREPLERLGFDIHDESNLRAESIFTVLLKGVEKKEISITQLPLPSDEEQELEGEQFDMTQDVLKQNGLEEELNYDNKSSISDTLWSNRVKKALEQAGKSKGSNTMGLLKHLYKPKVNWQAILRSFLVSRLKPEKEPDYSRPSRRNLAGVTKIFEPNRVKKRGIKRLAVCLDTSGSCWSSPVISKFVSNIDLVQSITGAELVVITFDDGIHEVEVIDSKVKLSDLINSNVVKFTGGGGTSFVEPIEEAIKHNPDVITVFTDCYGPFGEETKIPTIWASIGEEAPWGRNILIDSE